MTSSSDAHRFRDKAMAFANGSAGVNIAISSGVGAICQQPLGTHLGAGLQFAS